MLLYRLESGNPSKAFRYALHHEEVLLSLEVLEELSDVFGREKFDRFVTSEERNEFLEAFVYSIKNINLP